MLRSSVLLSLFLITAASAQSPAPEPEARPILRAVPLGDENAPSSVPPQTAPLEGPLPPSAGKPTGDDAVRLQIFLDEAHFGPGVVDGKPGRFTELAVFAWNEVNGHPSDNWTAV